ncbi:phosphoribosylanthranilate isomerase [Allokutzneria sp. A3M-2-11 16]|uniref:phosphoribosylanthranilate isomerase n=1 Tax=Allokutzneria sp. A3M-2-11 16 TaxID=2962043 RepID=UPI0020B78ECE|nr:phosphoribosylanthranilate isomerase [Allokutzneria sp. A3M-2-11 16]MCP3802609.1 phosphoribosylanthranilate isomerase [Allokutzneria sp. A3M-2-11 16]
MFVKICGLKTAADVECAVAEGADAVGFVLAKSPRQISVDEVARLVPLASVLTVGVFLGQTVAEIRSVVAATGIGAVQLHGSAYTAKDFADLADLGVPLVRATATDSPITVGSYGEDMLILDSPRAGSGEQWAWSALRGQTGRWMLAGGLAPHNVAEAIAAVHPWGVDVSSGVEVTRGTKDHALIRDFMKAARAH